MVWGLRFTVYGLRFTVYGLRFMVYDWGFTVYFFPFWVLGFQFGGAIAFTEICIALWRFLFTIRLLAYRPMRKFPCKYFSQCKAPRK